MAQSKASSILDLAGLDEEYIPLIEDIPKIEEALDCAIYIISNTCYNKIMRSPDEDIASNAECKLFIYHWKSNENEYHYDAITNITGFYGKGYFCTECFNSARSKAEHKCNVTCNICKTKQCLTNMEPADEICDDEYTLSDNGTFLCDSCNQECKSIFCYNSHK